MINHEYRYNKIKMELFDEINRLEAVTPNDGGLTKFEEGELSVQKYLFKKMIRKDYDDDK
jgi:hypothetical protein